MKPALGEQYFIGVDLGQSCDSTAIAVLERAELCGTFDPNAFAHRKVIELRLRYLERIPLGTTYPDVVQRVAQVTGGIHWSRSKEVIVDATGVGKPVLDMLKQQGLGCTILPVVITGGQTENWEKGTYMVPKRDLIVGLQLFFQAKVLQIAAGLEEGPRLVEELMAMQVRVTPAGNEQYAAWREGAHDDMVLAVAMACWGAKKRHPYPPRGEEAYCVMPAEFRF